MNDKELHLQKKQAQLEEWRADLNKLRAKALGASADAQLEMNKHIRSLSTLIDDNSTLLSEFSKSSGEAWDSLKIGVETAWEAMKNSVNDAKQKYKS